MTGVQITYPVDALVSFHYFREDRDLAPLVQTGRLRLIGDSGAFSAHSQGSPIDLDEYGAWCVRWREHLCWLASLDVIGDPTASLRNWRHLRERYGLAVVPTVHAGTAARWLDVYAGEGVDFVGLGGMAGADQAHRSFRWAVHMFRYARDRHPTMRFHLWGVTHRLFLNTLPVYSADSSGIFASTYRYGALRVFDPATGRQHEVVLRGRDVYKLGPLLRRVYGVDPAEIETSHPGNRGLLAQLTAACTQQYATWLQRRHRHVSAPTWGLRGPAPAGPRVHVVSSDGEYLSLAVAADLVDIP